MEKKLVSTKLGDEAWEISDSALHCVVFHFVGSVYIALMEEGLMVVDAKPTHPGMLLIAPWPHKEWKRVQMVKCSISKLRVLGNKVQHRASNDHKMMHKLFHLDSNTTMLIRMTNLGKSVMFVGEYNGGLVISTQYLDTLDLMPNTIYFKNDQPIVVVKETAYWKLDGYDNNAIMMLQDFDTDDSMENKDKWFVLNEDEYKMV
ncbi:hypothetical protein GUJ93_ZPchr0006g40738 [Zizania palustris]|uniref:KIB1-4 beta-propeller domain-containing protein n=1 Tax=Zizania palustris TaxID=103762 RepID=A0A8J5VL99_ZIZPA|nr:hypothetical protein GUJ93_ZPchr0006g40738 [Zizania palustris]